MDTMGLALPMNENDTLKFNDFINNFQCFFLFLDDVKLEDRSKGNDFSKNILIRVWGLEHTVLLVV